MRAFKSLLCRIFGHTKNTYVCAQGGHHCQRCDHYLSVRTQQAVDGYFYRSSIHEEEQ